MNKLQAAQDKFRSTREIAIEAYKKWKEECSIPKHTTSEHLREGYLLLYYQKAWQEHHEAYMALFLLETE